MSSAAVLYPSFCAVVAYTVLITACEYAVRYRKSSSLKVEMTGELDTQKCGMRACTAIGATASVTALDQVPRMACTRLTSTSLRAPRTPASGLVWSSSVKSWICLPATPPALLISSATSVYMWDMVVPYTVPPPVSGVRTPMRSASGWACARPPSSAAAPPASPVARN